MLNEGSFIDRGSPSVQEVIKNLITEAQMQGVEQLRVFIESDEYKKSPDKLKALSDKRTEIFGRIFQAPLEKEMHASIKQKYAQYTLECNIFTPNIPTPFINKNHPRAQFLEQILAGKSPRVKIKAYFCNGEIPEEFLNKSQFEFFKIPSDPDFAKICAEKPMASYVILDEKGCPVCSLTTGGFAQLQASSSEASKVLEISGIDLENPNPEILFDLEAAIKYQPNQRNDEQISRKEKALKALGREVIFPRASPVFESRLQTPPSETPASTQQSRQDGKAQDAAISR